MNKFPLALEMLKWALQQMGLLDWLLPLRLNAHLFSRLEAPDEVRCSVADEPLSGDSINALLFLRYSPPSTVRIL